MVDLGAIWRKYRYVIGGGGGVLIALVVVFLLLSPNQEIEVMAYEPETTEEASGEEASSAEESVLVENIFVEVKGAVKHPGVFELPPDARVKNVLEMAQLEPEADLLTVNQSMKLVDEMVIHVPKVGEETAAIEAPGPTDEGASGEDKVNINTASIEELTTLNGIGEKKAQLFIDYREENGLFMKLEDIKNISGIGDKTYESLEPYITIDE
ncbi:helix-hairpin-helix domain-containing protein [Salinicoccus sp. ID82-1]|uniref:helix-hairpin-helix domain-containing protein n=1 Tax=Salinicoccus sp. ID82-1 TaxID=2820269 RepID=UPI001F207C7B|nr:helix-hairpin-helix domain-containing protein [Salinicoccus sp. ID82-1]MCG1008899.1 helix-hairpin-helix domain-containing protein [Salinicoccus sp. ID82-1]